MFRLGEADRFNRGKKRDLRRLRRDLGYQISNNNYGVQDSWPQLEERYGDNYKSYPASDLPPNVLAQMESPESLLAELTREKQEENERRLAKLIEELQLLQQLSMMVENQQAEEVKPPTHSGSSFRRNNGATANR